MCLSLPDSIGQSIQFENQHSLSLHFTHYEFAVPVRKTCPDIQKNDKKLLAKKQASIYNIDC
jgi:hypothetical protein